MSNADLLFHIRSLTRVIYYVTEEEDRFLVKLKEVLSKFEKSTWVFNSALGLKPLSELMRDWATRSHTENEDCRDINSALIRIYRDDPRDSTNFYVITDPERVLADPNVQRRVLNVIHQLHQDDHIIKVIIFVGQRAYIPQKLQRYIEVVHDTGLTETDIQELLSDVSGKLNITPPTDAVKAFRGLTSYEADSAIAQSIVKTKKEGSEKRIDTQVVADFKRRQLRKTDLLQYSDTSEFTFDKVGGLQRFKEWVTKTKAAWTDEGQKFGLRPPKGVLAVGVWGCGKSLSVKAMGNAWGLPVVQLEMGKLRSSGVGESEANVYRAISLIESVAPCVTGETQVTLADGTTQPIEELWQDFSGDLEVQCWNERTLKLEKTKVQAVTRREAEAFAITAANGFSINATGNHQHYVLRGGSPEWVRTDELTRGDMLAVPTHAYDGKNDCTSFHPIGMRMHTREDGSMELRRGGGGYRDAMVSKLPQNWSTDLGWLLGMIESDGHISKKGQIGLTNTATCLLDTFEVVMQSEFGLKLSRHLLNKDRVPNLPGLSAEPVFQPCWTTAASNVLAAEFLRSARAAILSAPAQVRAAFLAGWIDGDGCIGPEKVSISVKDPTRGEERRRLVRQIVQSLGIVPSKFDAPNFEMTGSRAVALAAKVGEFLVLKGQLASKVASSDAGFDRGMGFACGALLAETRKQSGATIDDMKEANISTSVMWRHENGTTPISERQMSKYLEVFGHHAQELERISSAECRWVEISSIESIGEQVVYDLACVGEDTHSFIANGLVTHNCLVWVDEAEKSLSGNQSSAASDAGTTSRTIGILSTWLQETKAHVCLAMTANSVKTLPVEFVNRMDERFFFDLPSEEERIDILKIHLEAARQDPKKFQLQKLAELAKNMVGREISQAIDAAMTESFAQSKPGLDNDILAEQLRCKPRIFKTMVDELKETLDWVGYDPDVDDGIRARFASAKRNEVFNTLRVEK